MYAETGSDGKRRYAVDEIAGAFAVPRKVRRVRQVTAARAGALREMHLGPGRNLPPHRRAPAARLLPPPLVTARSAVRRCFLGGFRPGRSSDDGGIEESPLFRDPARAAAANCSRSSATTPPAPRSAPPGPGSAHPEDPRAAPPAAHWSQPAMIPEPTNSHHGNTAHAAKT
jgi:hypothetical protein